MKIDEFLTLDPDTQQATRHDILLRDGALLQVLDKVVKRMVRNNDELGLGLLNQQIGGIVAEGMIALKLIVEQDAGEVTLQ